MGVGVGGGMIGGAGTRPTPPLPEPPPPPPPPPPRPSPGSSVGRGLATGAIVPVGAPTATCWVNCPVRPLLCLVSSSTCCELALRESPEARTPVSGPPGEPRKTKRTTSATAVAMAAKIAGRERERCGAAMAADRKAALFAGARSVRARASRIARPSVARAKRAAPFSSALIPSSDKRIRPAARAAAVRSARDSARPSATRRANRRERCSTRSAWDSLVIEIELKRKSPSLIPGDELVVRLHDRPREWTRVELRRGGLGDAVTVERIRL